MSVSLLQPLRSTGPVVEDADGNTILILDASLGETHDHQGELTDHPVEKGGVVTDHFVKRPFELTITGLITNTPSDPQLEAVELALSEAGLVGTRIQSTYAIMREVWEAGNPLTIDTGLETYENMVMTSFSIPRGIPVQAIRPQMKFKQVRFATSQVIAVPPDILAAEVRASGQSETDGDQQAEKTEKNEDNRTRAKQALEFAADALTGLSGGG